MRLRRAAPAVVVAVTPLRVRVSAYAALIIERPRHVMADSPPAVEIRSARPAEAARTAALLYGSPSQEAAGIAGSEEKAAHLARGLHDAGVSCSPEDEVWVALLGDEIVAAALVRRRWGGFPVSLRSVLKAVPVVLRYYGWRELPGLLRRARLRGQLDFPVPDGSYHVVEIHVEPAERGRGIGAALLAHCEAVARERGCRWINLTTALANPARRLYAREGYQEAGRRTLPGYADLTGTEGRVFLEKRL
jgi:ribosomal protein S18 acetylase RimI-like enzyme